MNDQEKAAKIARMMGWEMVDTIHIINKDGQCAWHWAKDGRYKESEFYDPANNVAQAIEAAEAWRLNDANERWWRLYSPLETLSSDIDKVWNCRLFTDGSRAADGNADTPAAAIVEALLAALGGGA